MNKGIINIILLVTMAILIVFLYAKKSAISTNNNNKDVTNRRPQKLFYTKHAKCRMACRHFDESEVWEILETGKVNKNKTRQEGGVCPTYALEGTTHDGQHARMVYAICESGDVRVVTVIDLDRDWPCDCK